MIFDLYLINRYKNFIFTAKPKLKIFYQKASTFLINIEISGINLKNNKN